MVRPRFARAQTTLVGGALFTIGSLVGGCGLVLGIEPLPIDEQATGNAGGAAGMSGSSTASGTASVSSSGAGGSAGGMGAGGMGGTSASSSSSSSSSASSSSSSSGTGGAPGCPDYPVPTWQQSIRGMGEQIINDVAVDESGNVIVVGSVEQTSAFNMDCQSGACPLESNGGSAIFIAKLDSLGTPLWVRVASGTGMNLAQQAKSVAVDGMDNIIVGGTFNGNVTFGSIPLNNADQSLTDIFITKLNSNGDYLWSKNFGGVGNENLEALAVYGNGDILFTGDYDASFSFDGGMTQTPNSGGKDIFVAKIIAATEVLQWNMHFSTTSDEQALGLAVDSVGGFAIGGRFDAAMNFGGGNLPYAGATDLFIASFNAAKMHKFSKSFGDSIGLQEVRDVAFDNSDNLLITGRFSGSLNFPGFLLQGKGLYDTFTAKLDTMGGVIWAKLFGATGQQMGESIVSLGADVWVTGSFGANPIFNQMPATNAGNSDTFLLRYASSNGAEKNAAYYGGTGTDGGTAIARTSTGELVLGMTYNNSAVNLGCGMTSPAMSMNGTDILITQLKP